MNKGRAAAAERTVDKLQKQLQKDVFHYAKDGKKAAGRALGTLIEIITYYKICSWGLAEQLGSLLAM